MDHRARRGLEYLKTLEEWKGSPDFGLRKITSVLDCLGAPQDSTKAVHITGTNGKGSVSAATAAILGAAGYSVGLTISPHLKSINERIVVDGVSITDEDLGRFAAEVERAAASCDVVLSFFEGITATAFFAFNELALDWMVLEVGLGGRLDGTNVVKHPLGTAITSVSLDHEHILGSSIQRIAREKAGIIKRGAKLVTGRLPHEALQEIWEVAEPNGVAPFVLGRDFEIFGSGESFDLLEGEEKTRFQSRLRGAHQAENLGVAIKLCKELGVSLKDCERGVSSAFWPGRLEQVNVGRRAGYIDCAHNVAGVEALTKFLKQNNFSRLTLGFGVLDTKRWQDMIDILCPFVEDWNILIPDSGRALDPKFVIEYLSCKGISAKSFGDDYQRFIDTELSRGQGPFLVTGSIYMVGKFRSLVVPTDTPLWEVLSREKNL